MRKPDIPYVFVCHSHPENDSDFRAFMHELKVGLASRGIDCFIDHEDFHSGDKWQEKLLINLDGADAIVVVLNKELACSDYCGLERGYAYARQIPELVLVYDKDITLQEFSGTQRLDKYKLTEPWWKELEHFVNRKHCDRKQYSYINEVNEIISATPHLTSAQLHSLLKTITEAIGAKLSEEYASTSYSKQVQTSNNSNIVTIIEQVRRGGEAGE